MVGQQQFIATIIKQKRNNTRRHSTINQVSEQKYKLFDRFHCYCLLFLAINNLIIYLLYCCRTSKMPKSSDNAQFDGKTTVQPSLSDSDKLLGSKGGWEIPKENVLLTESIVDDGRDQETAIDIEDDGVTGLLLNFIVLKSSSTTRVAGNTLLAESIKLIMLFHGNPELSTL